MRKESAMPYISYDLPKYPCERDMWDELAAERRPIVVYGMGNGADKLIERFAAYGIEVADFFASDGFVRGHSFHGKRVKSFSEIKETYPEFVIVLSFASNRTEVLDMLADIDAHYDMYVPDMPVAGTEEYFDREFFNENYSSILAAYECLSDDESRAAFSAVINYKLSGRMRYLEGAYSDRDDIYGLLPCGNIRACVDAGAYNGDTVREAIKYFPALERVWAIEPDARNFKKLLRFAEEAPVSVNTVNAAAWCENTDGAFLGSGNRNSSVSSTASFEHRCEAVSLLRIDSLTDERIDYVKYDVEGAEAEALRGSAGVILRDRPSMLVSLYHRSRDIFDIVNDLAVKYPFYNLYLRRLRCVPAWELDLLLVPK